MVIVVVLCVCFHACVVFFKHYSNFNLVEKYSQLK